ncbi:hypothetical protein ACFOEQ_17610 [Chryseobacterium arachidis]|uniref:hypothetical protein n=1 Tax=Chryseobacterium arachidis TaxID=1416778 RepID=UPI00361319D7
MKRKTQLPKNFSSAMLQSKGFVPEITVDDFSAPRKKTVKLHIKRRRWTDVKKQETSSREIGILSPKEHA